MYDYFNGFITDKKNTSKGFFITIEVSGMGFLLEVTERDFITLNINENDKHKIFVWLNHREDSMALFGFVNKETRDIFQILISVSGVGAKMAIALLNEFDTCNLISLVVNGNFKELTKAKGVGPKLAQKIILELKDKLMKTELPKSNNTEISLPAFDDTLSVLLSLGYEQKEIEDAIAKISPSIQNNSDTEDIIRKTLTVLSM